MNPNVDEPIERHVLWRYPVKSMQGEQIAHALVTQRGVLGDRAMRLFSERWHTTPQAPVSRCPAPFSRLLRASTPRYNGQQASRVATK